MAEYLWKSTTAICVIAWRVKESKICDQLTSSLTLLAPLYHFAHPRLTLDSPSCRRRGVSRRLSASRILPGRVIFPLFAAVVSTGRHGPLAMDAGIETGPSSFLSLYISPSPSPYVYLGGLLSPRPFSPSAFLIKRLRPTIEYLRRLRHPDPAITPSFPT